MFHVIDPTLASFALARPLPHVQLALPTIHEHERSWSSLSPLFLGTHTRPHPLPASGASASARPILARVHPTPACANTRSLPTLPARHTLPPFHSPTTTITHPVKPRSLVPRMLAEHERPSHPSISAHRTTLPASRPLHERECTHPRPRHDHKRSSSRLLPHTAHCNCRSASARVAITDRARALVLPSLDERNPRSPHKCEHTYPSSRHARARVTPIPRPVPCLCPAHKRPPGVIPRCTRTAPPTAAAISLPSLPSLPPSTLPALHSARAPSASRPTPLLHTRLASCPPAAARRSLN